MIITMVIFVEDDNQGCLVGNDHLVGVDNQGCLPHYVAAIYHMGGLSQCGAGLFAIGSLFTSYIMDLYMEQSLLFVD